MIADFVPLKRGGFEFRSLAQGKAFVFTVECANGEKASFILPGDVAQEIVAAAKMTLDDPVAIRRAPTTPEPARHSLSCVAGRAALDRHSSSTVACVLQNLSPTHAQAVFSAGIKIPRYFDLFVGRSTRARRVRVISHQGDIVQLEILEPQLDAPEVLQD